MDCVSTELKGYLRQAGQLPLKKRREKYEALIKEMNQENEHQSCRMESQVWCHVLTRKLSELELQKQQEIQKNNLKK